MGIDEIVEKIEILSKIFSHVFKKKIKFINNQRLKFNFRLALASMQNTHKKERLKTIYLI